MKLKFTNEVSNFTHRLKDTKDFDDLYHTFPWLQREVNIDNLSPDETNYRSWLQWDKEGFLEYYEEIV